MQEVRDNKWFECVELKLSTQSAQGDGCMVPNHFRADHSHGLTLCWVDFTRHERATRLVLGQNELAQPRTWTRPFEADVLSDFEEGAGEGI